MSDAIKIRPSVESEGPAPEGLPSIGAWFWVTEKNEKGEEYDPWLGCVTHVGSNYVQVTGPSEQWENSQHNQRIHLDTFEEQCKPAPDAEAIIAKKVESHRKEVGLLMGKVQEITERLAISMGPAQLGAGTPASTALALHDKNGPDPKQYKKALIKAKEQTLPELFKKIKNENGIMGSWMKAALIPLEAQAEAMRPAIKAIENRIFSVELYAGLIEQVEQIKEGKPAAMGEKLHLFQRRCYMDEECLANYEAGGMTFKGIGAFDQWLARPENLDRILPKPRCMVAFRVRRNERDLSGYNLRAFIDIVMNGELEADKWTFLYIRNGEQLFRLNTGVEFDERLFPDLDRANFTQPMWAETFSGRVEKLITEGEYLQMVADEKREQEEFEAKRKKFPKSKWQEEGCYFPPTGRFYTYKPYTPENVFFDDIQRHIQKEIDSHNRIVLILQGLLDRSPVLHPHPVWRLWEADGFSNAISLVFDADRTLTPGEAPDFDAYRAKLNETIGLGSITVGQERAWEIIEARKENDRRSRSWRYKRSDSELKRFRPYGNPGPGILAKVASFSKKGCIYRWTRKRQSLNQTQRWEGKAYDDTLNCSVTIDPAALLNVSAYKPGDFRQFYNDPRTRALYLKWAPLLLIAEDYYAGKRKLGESSEGHGGMAYGFADDEE